MFKLFFEEWKEWNFRTALGYLLLRMVFDFNDLSKMKITYQKNNYRPYELTELRLVK